MVQIAQLWTQHSTSARTEQALLTVVLTVTDNKYNDAGGTQPAHAVRAAAACAALLACHDQRTGPVSDLHLHSTCTGSALPAWARAAQVRARAP